MTSMEQQQQGGTNSSHDEGNIKEEKDGNRRKRIESSSSPTTSFNDETHKNGGENDKKNDDGDGNFTTSTAEHNNKDSSICKQGEELESTKAEIGDVMEENQTLKQYLNQALKDYQILQRKFHEISQQDPKQLKDNQMATPPPTQALGGDDDEDDDEAELVSLSLGRSSSLDSKKGNTKLSSPSKLATNHNNDHKEANERSLDLGLECNFKASSTSMNHQQTLMPSSSADHSLDETKDGEVVKNNDGIDEVVHQPPVKKARVSVRVRCDTPTMNDGCQWRKYGQKIAKGNPCPRAYYRCTVAPSCPVRKQVQRCAEDMSILITTYEGAHNHPLPVSASAMASTTSAAAYMLMSKSSTSSNPGSYPSTTTTTTSIGAEIHGGLKFDILENSKPNPFYSPNNNNSSTYSPTPTHPTVTLDLTSSTNNQFNKVAPNLGTRYSSTNLTFNFSDNNASNNNPFLFSWPKGLPSYNTQPYINQAKDSPLLNIGSFNDTYNFQNNLLQKSNNPPNRDSNLPDTFTQAAKVLTSDPNFQSILTATLSSFISGNNNGNVDNGIGENNTIHHEGERNNIKWGGFHTSSSTNLTFQSTSMDTNGYGSSLFNKVPLESNSLPFSTTKSTSPSPDNKNHTT